MEKEILVKTIKKEVKDKIEAGIIWYKIMNVRNNLGLAKREIELLSFINYRGTISSLSSKEEFCRIFDSSMGTISNMVSKLTIMKLLVKEKSKTKITPLLRVDFNNDLVIRFFVNIIDNNSNTEEVVTNEN